MFLIDIRMAFLIGFRGESDYYAMIIYKLAQ